MGRKSAHQTIRPTRRCGAAQRAVNHDDRLGLESACPTGCGGRAVDRDGSLGLVSACNKGCNGCRFAEHGERRSVQRTFHSIWQLPARRREQ